jgi:hypothetical protein
MLASSRKMVEDLGIAHRLFEADVFAGRLAAMEGDAATAERLLRGAYEGLRELGPRDRFNILAFSSEVVRFQKTSVEHSPANALAAARFLDKLRPQGRTDLRKALLEVASQKATLPRLVFLISDGSASAGCLDGREIVADAIQALDADTVVYGVQVGTSTERTPWSRAGSTTTHWSARFGGRRAGGASGSSAASRRPRSSRRS